MASRSFRALLLVLALIGTFGCSSGDNAADSVPAAAVDAARLLAADAEPENWMSHGRTYDEQRHSPLDQVNTENVGDPGLAWSFDLATHRGIEATSIVVDGAMYMTGSWSIVHALDAATSAEEAE